MIGLTTIASVFAGASKFDLAMMGINAVSAVTGLLGSGNKSQAKAQKKVVKAKMAQLESQKEIAKMTTEYNVGQINESFLENFGRMNNEYARAHSGLAESYQNAYDSMIISMGHNSGIDRSESIKRREQYLSDAIKTAGLNLSENQKQDLMSLSKNTMQSIMGQTQNYYDTITNLDNSELNLQAELINIENKRKANQLSGLQDVLNSITNIGDIAVKSYENYKSYNQDEIGKDKQPTLSDLFNFEFKDIDLSLFPRV